MISVKNQDLQLLRGIAISMVLFCHLSLSSTLLAYVNKTLVNSFYWGVELFFVLSGFVVTKSIRSKHFNPAYFLVKRVFRLYPAILFLILCATLINAFVTKSTYPEFIRGLFGITSEAFRTQSSSILGGYLINITAPISYQYAAMWSLSVEFQFYAFVTLLLVLLVLCANFIKDKALALIALAVFLAAFLYRIYISFAPPPRLNLSNISRPTNSISWRQVFCWLTCRAKRCKHFCRF
jgi:peptidoglycan/LPS O-acetylase OafA/YrhL